MAKIYFSLPWQPFCFEGKICLISLVYPTKHVIYQNLEEIGEMPCPTRFGGYVERLLIGMRFSQMSNFRRVKNSHVFVIPVKNSFELFTSVTNTCKFSTRVTDSFECESQTNLSQV